MDALADWLPVLLPATICVAAFLALCFSAMPGDQQ